MTSRGIASNISGRTGSVKKSFFKTTADHGKELPASLLGPGRLLLVQHLRRGTSHRVHEHAPICSRVSNALDAEPRRTEWKKAVSSLQLSAITGVSRGKGFPASLRTALFCRTVVCLTTWRCDFVLVLERPSAKHLPLGDTWQPRHVWKSAPDFEL